MNMATSQFMSSRGSSKALINGAPSISAGIHQFVDVLPAHFNSALSRALVYARTDLRRAAHTNPDWAEFEDILDVEFDGEDFVYVLTGTPERNAQAIELEYGTPTRSPNSLLRKVAIKQPVILGKIMGDYLSEKMPSA